MLYTLTDILEDVDYGCEERDESSPRMAVAVLHDPDGKEIRFPMADVLFDKRNLAPGDRVYIDEHNTLQKAIVSPDWTQDFSGKDVDVSLFLQDMEDLIGGRKKRWVCPFCGGDVIVLQKDGQSSQIGCSDCDMRIELSTSSLAGEE